MTRARFFSVLASSMLALTGMLIPMTAEAQRRRGGPARRRPARRNTGRRRTTMRRASGGGGRRRRRGSRGGAKVYFTQRRVPQRATEQRLLSFARSNRARFLNETTGGPIEERSFRAEMVINFPRPLGDLEYHVIFRDITSGAPVFVADYVFNVNNREQRTYVQRISLPRAGRKFQVDHEYEAVITVRRQEVGRTTFRTRGERIQHSGVVNFD